MIKVLLLVVVGLFLAGCGDTAAVPPTATPRTATGMARPVPATKELVVGPNRFVFGLVDSGTGQPIEDIPQVTIQFFKVHEDDTATKISDANVVYQDENLPAGLFVARTEFNEAGKWGAVFSITPPSGSPYQTRVNFTVAADSPVPNVGEAAPPSRNLTKQDVADQGEIDSAVPLDTMHDLSIADAVRSGKPSLILFATPGYCESRMCGPDLQVMQALQQKYGAQANFIHIETPSHTHTEAVGPEHYTASGHGGVAQPQIITMTQWGLTSEPWIFVVDKDGKIAERFEGGLTLDEVEPAVVTILPQAVRR